MIKQETPYNCGPACLQIVWKLMGREDLPQSAFAAMAGTTTAGTGIWGLKKAIRAMGYDYVVKRGKQSLYRTPSKVAIVYDPKRDHWMVAEKLNKRWNLHDPETALTEKHNRITIRSKVFSKYTSYSIFVTEKA